MKRTATISKPDYILTSDWHLRETQPVSWTEDFEPHQWRSVRFVRELQEKYDCPILCGGDLFHHWKPSPALLSKTIKNLPKKFYTVYGNHDLPNHSLALLEKCGVFTLEQARCADTKSYGVEGGFELCHFRSDPKNLAKILVWHQMTYQLSKPFPGCTDPRAAKLLRQYPHYDLIITGDNHESFVEEYQGRILVNPGSLTRQTAKQIDFLPSVYLYYAKTNTVERIFIPIKEGVISREHLEVIEARDARIDAFVSSLNTDWQVGLSFAENLKQFEQTNQVKSSIIDIIYKNMEV